MKLEHAARQALECLEDVFGKGKVDVGAINALREALDHSGEANEMVAMNLNCKSVQARLATLWGYVKAEQAEQEPVAWMSPNKERLEFSRKDTVYGSHTIPLYAAPVRTKDLTDDEIYDALMQLPFGTTRYEEARAVIAADREKNK